MALAVYRLRSWKLKMIKGKDIGRKSGLCCMDRTRSTGAEVSPQLLVT
jgi:hypothetical protein